MFASIFRALAVLILVTVSSQASAQQCNQTRNGSGQIVVQECFVAPGSSNQWTPGSQFQLNIGVPFAIPNGTNLNIPEGLALRQCTDSERATAFINNTARNAVLGAIDGWAQTNRSWGVEAGSRAGVRLAIAQTHSCYKLVKLDDSPRAEVRQKKSRCESGELAKNDQDGTLWCVIWQDKTKGLIASRTEPTNN